MEWEWEAVECGLRPRSRVWTTVYDKTLHERILNPFSTSTHRTDVVHTHDTLPWANADRQLQHPLSRLSCRHFQASWLKWHLSPPSMNASEKLSEWNWVGRTLNHLRFRFLNANQSEMSVNWSNSEFAMYRISNGNLPMWGDPAIEIHPVRSSSSSGPGSPVGTKIWSYSKPLI